jgi:hypothetical protein
MRPAAVSAAAAPVAALLAAAIVAAVAVAACTSGGLPSPGGSTVPTPSTAPSQSPSPAPTATGTGPITYATGSTDLVLQVAQGGGLMPQSMRLAEMPDVSIYGDGRVIKLVSSSNAQTDPMLPNLTEARVTPDGMARILQAAREAGLLRQDRRYDIPDLYDLWTVWFTVVANGQAHQVAAYALGFSEESMLAPPGEMEDRKKLDDFFGKVLDLGGWLGPEAVGTEDAYAPVETRVYVTRLVDWSTAVGGATPGPVKPRPGQEVRGWPLDSPPEKFGAPAGDHDGVWRCAVLDPKGVAALGLDKATKDTRWQAGDQLYQIVARPLLPDEPGCPEV